MSVSNVFSKPEQDTFLASLTASPEFGNRELRRIPLSATEPWAYNPDIRTEAAALKKLTERLTSSIGLLQPGSVVAWEKAGEVRYRCIDMHRRRRVLLNLGIKEVEAIVYTDVKPGSEKFQRLFDILNGGNRLVGSREQTSMALYGADTAAGPQGQKNAQRARELLNADALKLFHENSCPNAALVNAKGAFMELYDRGIIGVDPKTKKVDKKEERAFVSECYTWQANQGQQQELKIYLTEVREAWKRDSKVKARNMCIKLLTCIQNKGSLKDLRNKD